MAVSAMVALASTTASYVAGTMVFSTFLATFAFNFAMGVALNALTPKPKINGAQRGYQVNSRGSALSHQIIYGKARVGGAIVYDEATGADNKYLHRIIAVSGHEIESFDEIYINDEVATIDVDGNVTSPSQYNGKIRINTHLGSPDQTADADLVSESAKWTAQHRLRGIAYMYIRMEFDADAFPNGVPTFTATVKGKKVYNPNTDTTAWSDNPALCLRDYLTSSYGLSELPDNIDDDLVNAAVAVCNQTNTDAGTTRYTTNGAFTTDLTPYDVINNLLTSMSGSLWYAQGKWRVKPGYWTAPVLDLNEDDLRSSIGLSTRHSRRDNFNVVKGTFRGEESNWQTTDYPQVNNKTDAGSFVIGNSYAITSVGTTDFSSIGAASNTVGEVFVATGVGSGDGYADANLGADNGQESVADVDLPFTDNSIEARRIARIALESNRQQLTVTASFGLKAMQVQVGDNVRLTNSRFGWVNKEFQVLSWNFGLTDGLDLQVNLVLRETAESVFDEVDDGVVYERDNTNLPSPFDGLTIANLSVSEGGRTQSDGTFVNSALLSWDSSDNAFVSHYEVDWKPSTSSDYSSTTTVSSSIELSPIVDNLEYVFRVRAITLLGNGGTISSTTYTLNGDTSAPNSPTNFSAESGYKYIALNFDLPTASDFNRVEVYEGTSTNFGASVSIGFASGNSFVRTGLGNNVTRYYWIRSQDHSGNNSAFIGPVNATTSLVEETDLTQSLIDTIESAGVSAVNSLPVTGDFDGQIVFLLTDNTLYRWDDTGGVWSTELYTGIEDGSVTETSIADDSISTPKLQTGSVTADQISAGAVTTDKLLADAVVANKIAAGAVTADKISVSELSAITANLGTIEVDTANIADAAISSAKIAGTLESDNYTTGSTGWQITKSGAAEFNSLVVREPMIQDGAVSEQYVANQTSGSTITIPARVLTAGTQHGPWQLITSFSRPSGDALSFDIASFVRWTSGFNSTFVPLIQVSVGILSSAQSVVVDLWKEEGNADNYLPFSLPTTLDIPSGSSTVSVYVRQTSGSALGNRSVPEIKIQNGYIKGTAIKK